MAQLALAILVLAVLVTFAVLARRAGQKRASWAFVALAVLISAAFSYVGWRTSRAPPQLDPEQVVIELGSANVTGAGWRLTGFVTNTGDTDVASLVVRVKVRDCRDAPCKLIDQADQHAHHQVEWRRRQPGSAVRVARQGCRHSRQRQQQGRPCRQVRGLPVMPAGQRAEQVDEGR